MRFAAIVCCALLCVGCSSTSYKVAPSTAKVATKIAVAKSATREAVKRTLDFEIKTKETQIQATTTSSHIDAALVAIEKRDYVDAAMHMVAAKGSNALVEMLLKQSLTDILSLRSSLETTESNLTAAEGDVGELNKTIEKIVIQGAKDRAIVEEVNWGFRVGALLYFIKGVLKMGFIGTIILVVVGIVLLVLAGTVGGPFLKMAGWLWGLIWRRKS